MLLDSASKRNGARGVLVQVSAYQTSRPFRLYPWVLGTPFKILEVVEGPEKKEGKPLRGTSLGVRV